MNLLITGAWQDAGKHLDEIRAMGHCVKFLQQERDPLPCDYAWVEGVVCNGLFLYHSIEKFENLKFVQLTSAGYDRVDMHYINRKRIEIHNARGVYSIPMAEFALTGVLQLYKHMDFFRENQKRHVWEKHRGLLELSGKEVCILGCGSVGTECAKRFSAFGCRVAGVDVAVRQDPAYHSMVPLEALNQTLNRADILVLTLPLTPQTRNLLDAERIGQMKPGALLVNIARGAVADTRALTAALESGHLGGAVLDVFEEEPLAADSPLWDMENVIVTPHNSFVGENNGSRLRTLICDNLIKR